MAQENNLDVQKELTDIVAQILRKSPSDIPLDARFVEDLGMDSILSIEILAATEKKFKITIPDDELKKVATLRQAIDLAKKYLSQKKT